MNEMEASANPSPKQGISSTVVIIGAVVLVVVILLVGGFLVYRNKKSAVQMMKENSDSVVSNKLAGPSASPKTQTPNTDAQLDQDLKDADKKINAAGTDLNDVNSGLNDQQVVIPQL